MEILDIRRAPRSWSRTRNTSRSSSAASDTATQKRFLKSLGTIEIAEDIGIDCTCPAVKREGCSGDFNGSLTQKTTQHRLSEPKGHLLYKGGVHEASNPICAYSS